MASVFTGAACIPVCSFTLNVVASVVVYASLFTQMSVMIVVLHSILWFLWHSNDATLFADTIVPVGKIQIASLSQLQPLATTQSHTHSVKLPSLSDLELDSGTALVYIEL